MVGETKPDSVSTRFGPYLGELREFFTSRQVRFGNPEDLIAFAERAAELGPFQDEMGSMVRSIMYREHELLGRGELVQLLAVAVGGPEVEGAAQTMQGAVRQLFLFVNGALRQRRTSFPEDAAAEDARNEAPVTAGDILATSAGREQPARVPASPRSSRLEPEAPPEVAAARAESEPGSTGMLFRAVSMAADQPSGRLSGLSSDMPSDLELHRRARRVPQWLVPAIAAGLAVAGVGLYAGTHVLGHRDGAARLAGVLGPAPSQARAEACVAPMAAGVSRSGIEERSRWAHTLLDQQLYEVALPELQEIARLDPGYPGIKLDESQTLLQLKKPEEAREAVDAQIAVSECLAKQPRPVLEAYCSDQYPESTRAGCLPQLTHLREGAQLQAALVHLELGHRMAADGSAEAALAELTKEPDAAPVRSRPAPVAPKARRVLPLPPATEGDADEPPMPRPAPIVRVAPAGAAAEKDAVGTSAAKETPRPSSSRPQ